MLAHCPIRASSKGWSLIFGGFGIICWILFTKTSFLNENLKNKTPKIPFFFPVPFLELPRLLGLSQLLICKTHLRNWKPRSWLDSGLCCLFVKKELGLPRECWVGGDWILGRQEEAGEVSLKQPIVVGEFILPPAHAHANFGRLIEIACTASSGHIC